MFRSRKYLIVHRLLDYNMASKICKLSSKYKKPFAMIILPVHPTDVFSCFIKIKTKKPVVLLFVPRLM